VPGGEVVPNSDHPIPKTECLEDPDARCHNHHDVENHLDASRHGNINIDNFQSDTHHDERQHYVQDGPDVTWDRNPRVGEPSYNCHHNEGKSEVK
jgi:hypothetical protein